MTLKTSHLDLRRCGRSGHDAEHLGRWLGGSRRRSTRTTSTRREISLVDNFVVLSYRVWYKTGCHSKGRSLA